MAHGGFGEFNEYAPQRGALHQRRPYSGKRARLRAAGFGNRMTIHPNRNSSRLSNERS